VGYWILLFSCSGLVLWLGLDDRAGLLDHLLDRRSLRGGRREVCKLGIQLGLLALQNLAAGRDALTLHRIDPGTDKLQRIRGEAVQTGRLTLLTRLRWQRIGGCAQELEEIHETVNILVLHIQLLCNLLDGQHIVSLSFLCFGWLFVATLDITSTQPLSYR
jgi:hypothetical protein